MSEKEEQEHIVCKECSAIDSIVSIEEVIIRYPVYADCGEIEFDGTNGKTIHGEIDHLECSNCQAWYNDTDEVQELIEVKKNDTD